MKESRSTIQEYAAGWQEIVNLIAEIINVPAALIMYLTDKGELEVLLSSDTERNPYVVGENEIMENSGLYCERVIKTSASLKVPNALNDEEWKNNPDVKLNMISYLGFPIQWPEGTPFGTLCVLDNKENSYNKKYEHLLEKFKQTIEDELKLIRLNEKLKTLSDTDPLTGILNRRVFFEKLDIERYKSDRYKTPLTLLMFDFNNFKDINDTKGHVAGDKSLCSFVEITQKTIRPSDIFCRFGGDEFLLALPETNLDQAEKLGRRIISKIEEEKLMVGDTTVNFSVTFGLSEYKNSQTSEEFIKSADASLYTNKKAVHY